MAADPYAEDMSGDVRDERPEEASEETKERMFRRRKALSKNPQIGLDLVTLTEKIIFPCEEFPKYNFVGKLLGPRGSTLKMLQTDCKVRMSIMGRGSSKDRSKEDEMIQSGDPQYEHLKEPLHVIISARANKIEAHRRLASACRELNKFMGPVNEEMFLIQQPEHGGEPVNNGRDQVLPVATAPKIMFGVPPPGAIILNENPAFAPPGRMTRGDERSPPPRESYSYRGYTEGSDRGSGSRYGDKRGVSDSGYPLKRYKPDTYSKSQYTSR